jgi:ER membrane protein complex subunit 3
LAESEQTMAQATLLLDPDIRDWVVLPLFVIMIVAGLLRHYIGVLLAGDKKPQSILAQRAQATQRQTGRIRSSAAHYLPTSAWAVKRDHYAKLLVEQAEWCETTTLPDSEADDPLAMMNPMGMLKGNMTFMIQNMVMMQGIQHFFSGFILLRVPFPLTAGFKSMFQRGLADMPDLSSSFVSSVSWYFLVMYGLRSFLKLAIGEFPIEVKEQDMMSQQMGLHVPPPPNVKQDGKTLAKNLRQDAENMALLLQDFKSEMDSVEKRILKRRYPKKQLQVDTGLFAATRSSAKKKS